MMLVFVVVVVRVTVLVFQELTPSSLRKLKFSVLSNLTTVSCAQMPIHLRCSPLLEHSASQAIGNRMVPTTPTEAINSIASCTSSRSYSALLLMVLDETRCWRVICITMSVCPVGKPFIYKAGIEREIVPYVSNLPKIGCTTADWYDSIFLPFDLRRQQHVKTAPPSSKIQPTRFSSVHSPKYNTFAFEVYERVTLR